MTDADVIDGGPHCRIPVAEIRWRFTTSGGPGGQHANRSQTAVEAEIELASATGIEAETRQRLIDRLGPTLALSVDTTRSQHRNRQIAVERLGERLRKAQDRQAPRRPTRPSRSARRRRVDAKRRRSQTKALRRRPASDD